MEKTYAALFFTMPLSFQLQLLDLEQKKGLDKQP